MKPVSMKTGIICKRDTSLTETVIQTCKCDTDLTKNGIKTCECNTGLTENGNTNL